MTGKSENLSEVDDNVDTEVQELDIQAGETEEKVSSKNESGNDNREDKTDYKKLSIRDTIKKALEKTDVDENKVSSTSKKEVVETKEEEKDSELEDTEEKVDLLNKEEIKLEVPASWAKKKDIWGKLDADAKEFIAQREKEISDGFAKYGDDYKKFKEIDSVITAPRRQAIQQSGNTEAQVIDRLFHWMEALSSSNKLDAFKQLGENFGIDISKLHSATSSKQNNEDGNSDTSSDEIPPALKNYFDAVNNEIQELRKTFTVKEENEAANFVNNWASDKVHYENVRGIMHSLLASGTIPLKDGKLDLDTAYLMACRAHPEVGKKVAEEENAKKEQESIKAAEKAEREKQEKLKKAKSANVSLKPKAPVGGVSNINLNGKSPSKKLSVRDSIRSALKEIADT